MLGMHADQRHVFDAALFQDAPDLDAVVRDVVAIRIDRDRIHLSLPRRPGVAAHLGELRGPLSVFGEVVVLAAVALVDGIAVLVFGGNDVAPVADPRRRHGRSRRCLSALPRGMISVKLHATAGGVNDGRPATAGFGEEGVDARGQLSDAARGVQAVVQVPHIADDDGRGGGRPRRLVRHPTPSPRIRGGFHGRAETPGERRLVGGRIIRPEACRDRRQGDQPSKSVRRDGRHRGAPIKAEGIEKSTAPGSAATSATPRYCGSGPGCRGLEDRSVPARVLRRTGPPSSCGRVRRRRESLRRCGES